MLWLRNYDTVNAALCAIQDNAYPCKVNCSNAVHSIASVVIDMHTRTRPLSFSRSFSRSNESAVVPLHPRGRYPLHGGGRKLVQTPRIVEAASPGVDLRESMFHSQPVLPSNRRCPYTDEQVLFSWAIAVAIYTHYPWPPVPQRSSLSWLS